MSEHQHHQRKRVAGVTPHHVEEMTVEEVVVEVNPSEERVMIGLYSEMLRKIEEMYEIALGIESSGELAGLMSQLAMVKVSIDRVVERLGVEEMMKESERVYEESKGGDDV